MGLTQRLGTIPLAIQTDSSNNVGIGGAANASYKLAVTGASLFTGAATLSSSVTANGVMSLSDDGTYGSNYKTLGFTGNTNGNHRIFAGVTDGMFICSKTGEGIFFRVNGGTTNNLTISSAGNVGIGTSSPSSIFEVAQTNSIITQRGNTGYSVFRSYAGDGSSSDVVEFQIRNRVDGSNMVSIGNFTSHDLTFRTANTERMRIKANGDVQIGTTPTANGHNFFMEAGNGAYQSIGHPNGTTTGYSYTLYYYNSGVIGGISQSGTTAVVYNTTSDYRLKEVISPIQNSINTILKLNPVRFKWKNTKDEYGDGFLAHELQEIIPLAVTGEKDALNEDGTFKLQQVDLSKLVPYLVKAIQEQQEIINQLSAKVTALENK